MARINGLDLLRATAMLMGVLLHALVLYLEPEDGSEPVLWIGMLFLWIHNWRMPLFFMLAGFFAALSLDRKSPMAFSWDRLYRIGFPIVLWWLIVAPIPLWSALRDGADLPTLDHLWFLYYLVLMYAVAVVIRPLIPTQIISLIDLSLRSRWMLLLWAIPITAFSIVGRDNGLFNIQPEYIGEIELGFFFFSVTFFCLGWRLFHHQNLFSTIASLWWSITALILALVALVSALTIWLAFDEELTSLASLLWVNGLSSCATLLSILGLTGLCLRLVTAPSKLLSFWVELSYPIYFFHGLVVFSLGEFFLETDWPAFGAIAVNTVASTVISILLYFVFIRYTPLSWMFMGYKKAWFRWSKLRWFYRGQKA